MGKTIKKTFIASFLLFAITACTSQADTLGQACNQALAIDKKVKFTKPIGKGNTRCHFDASGDDPACPTNGALEYTKERNCKYRMAKNPFFGNDYKIEINCLYTIEDYSAFEKEINKKNRLVSESLSNALDTLRDSAQSNKDARFLYDQIYDLEKVFHLYRYGVQSVEWNDGWTEAKEIRKVCSIYK